jgi:5-methylthioadenosine/S-adenosylhomocysteine deaminase
MDRESGRLVIRGVRALTLDAADAEHHCADIVIHGSEIVAVGPDVGRDLAGLKDATIIDGRGLLAIPGLINGHFHSPANMLKGAVANRPLELFMLYEVPPLMKGPVSPRFAYVRTMLGIAQMLRQGVTAVHDDAFFVPVPTEPEIDAVMQAYEDSGMRATVTLDQPNVVEYEKHPFLADILPPALKDRMRRSPRMADGELLTMYQQFLARWHGRDRGRLRVGLSCSAPQRVTPSYLQSLADLSRKHDLPLNMHILETRLQRVLGDVKFGKSLIQHVGDLGVLDERSLVIHAVWIDENDIDMLAKASASVAHNPVSNLKLGSGVMPFRALKDAGVNICIGNDEAIVDDGINLWTVAKIAGLIHNISDPDFDRWPAAAEILEALTTGGARAMRLEGRIGCIAPGYQADLALLDLDHLAFTPLNDLRGQLIYCEPAGAVVTTIVAGRIVFHDGRISTFDETAIKAEARSLAVELASQMRETEEAARLLEPYYRDMYSRSLNHRVGIGRWVGGGADVKPTRGRGPRERSLSTQLSSQEG